MKVGKLSKNAIKTKNCNLLNHLTFYVTDKSKYKTFSVFSLTNLIVFCKFKKQQNVTPATYSKNYLGQRQNKTDCNTVTLFWKVPQLAL